LVSQPLRIREEYRELRDHLLARFSLDEPSTLLLIDAGREISDTSWLTSFAVALGQHLSEIPAATQTGSLPKILLVEAAGPASGIAERLGLDSAQGLADVLQGEVVWTEAVQATAHPQIELMTCGNALFQSDQSKRLESLWSELRQRYQVVLVAAGPWTTTARRAETDMGLAASTFLPLADAAILCVELAGTPKGVAVHTKRELEKCGVRLLGCVVQGESTASE
jgi:Mrp family chromosome partitioning ATPase